MTFKKGIAVLFAMIMAVSVIAISSALAGEDACVDHTSTAADPLCEVRWTDHQEWQNFQNSYRTERTDDNVGLTTIHTRPVVFMQTGELGL